jgi:phosphatidylglycerol---prolipoprotein diacylglyceryl transferase
MTLLQIVWDASPEVFSIGPVTVRWYGLFWALSFYIGYEILYRIFRKEKLPLKQADKLIIYIAVGTVIGARLGHTFFYDFDYYINRPLEILMIWRGGLASHGGAIGIIIALYYYQKKVSNHSFAWLADRLVIPLALGAFLIRMGNLMNSEIYGHTTDLPWGFIFVRRNEILPKHPTQIYEGLGYLLIFLLLGFMYIKNKVYSRPGMATGIFLILLFTVRFFIEYVKEVQSPFEEGMLLNMGQILSIPMILLGIYFIYRSTRAEKQLKKN